MTYNYHTHTYRCGHASGTAEEYIKRAIECGIKYMGFSDHMPFIFPDGYESGHRVPVSQVESYFSELTELREKYSDKIDIKIGFEMEYYPTHFKNMLKNAIEYGAEYLILGQHYLGEEHPDGEAAIHPTDSFLRLKEYTDCVISGIESGVFTYIAHPDMFNFTGDVSLYREEMRKICVASRTYGIPLEINFLGVRAKRNYPNEVFWKIAGEEKSPVTFGFDAHDAKCAFDGESFGPAQKIVEEYKLNYIGKPRIKLIQEMKNILL